MPLFSLVSSTRSWGIGDIADLPAIGAGCAGAGQRYVQLLPLNEMSAGETSPYSAMSAMAIDPIYICAPAVAGVRGARRRGALDRRRSRDLAGRRAPRVDYAEVRALKARAATAFDRFSTTTSGARARRAREAFLG